MKTFLKFLGNDSHVAFALLLLAAAGIGGSLALFHLRIGGWI